MFSFLTALGGTIGVVLLDLGSIATVEDNGPRTIRASRTRSTATLVRATEDSRTYLLCSVASLKQSLLYDWQLVHLKQGTGIDSSENLVVSFERLSLLVLILLWVIPRSIVSPEYGQRPF